MREKDSLYNLSSDLLPYKLPKVDALMFHYDVTVRTACFFVRIDLECQTTL